MEIKKYVNRMAKDREDSLKQIVAVSKRRGFVFPGSDIYGGFTPRRVAERSEQIRRIRIEHLEPALEQGTFDWVDDFAGRVPMDVISEMVGVPRADRAELRRLADLAGAAIRGLRSIRQSCPG